MVSGIGKHKGGASMQGSPESNAAKLRRDGGRRAMLKDTPAPLAQIMFRDGGYSNDPWSLKPLDASQRQFKKAGKQHGVRQKFFAAWCASSFFLGHPTAAASYGKIYPPG